MMTTKRMYLLVSVLLLWCGQNAACKPQADVFVAPNGHDTAAGTAADPLSTLSAARDTVRRLRAMEPKRDITVLVRGGTYRLRETVVFGLEDGATEGYTITYAAFPGEKPIFTSGVPIRGWRKLPKPLQGLPVAARGKVWVADVPKDLPLFFTLYDGDVRLPRARSKGFAPTKKFKSWRGDVPADRSEMHYPPGACRRWTNLTDAELLIIPTVDWTMNILPVAGIDETKRVLRVSVPGTYGLGPQKKKGLWKQNAWIENVPDALDAPGEWMLDWQRRKIYLWPRGAAPSDAIVAPALNEFLRVEGKIDAIGPKDTPVSGLVFRDLTLTCGRRDRWDEDHLGLGLQHDWDMFDRGNALVRFRGAEDCAVENCHFVHTSGSAVRFDLHAQRNRVTGCTVADVGGTGILLCGYGPGTKDVNHHNTIANTHIHHTGEIYWHGLGICVWQSGSNTIRNNLVHHTPYSGIVISGVRSFPRDVPTSESSRTIRWQEVGTNSIIRYPATIPYLHARDNVVAFNEVHNTMLRLGDGNGIYLSGAGKGNRIEHNYVHHILSPHVASAIRTDGWQPGTTIKGNIIYKCSRTGIILKDINHCENNIIVDIGPASNQIADGFISLRAGPNDDQRIQHNICYSSRPGYKFLTVKNLRHLPNVNLKGTRTDRNIYFDAADPKSAKIWLASHRKQTGIDAHSVVADPLFVDIVKADFRLKPNSPALKLGFKPIDPSRIGLLDKKRAVKPPSHKAAKL